MQPDINSADQYQRTVIGTTPWSKSILTECLWHPLSSTLPSVVILVVISLAAGGALIVVTNFKGSKMGKSLFLLLAAAITTNAGAQVYRCKGPDGKVQFSDTVCKAGISSEIVPDRAPVTEQQRYEAQQRALRMQDEAATLDAEKASAQAAYRAQQQRQQAETERKAAPLREASIDADAIAACVRDVERRGASQKVKAEMIAACRTAGLAQRSTGLSGDVVNDCVRRVERTSASEKEKARQLAICHGGDVSPESLPPPVQSNPPPLAIIKNCNGPTCTDQMGNRYTTTGGKTVRSDGKRCYQQGNAVYCD